VDALYFENGHLTTKAELIDFNLSRLGKMAEIVNIQLQNKMADSLQFIDLQLKMADLNLAKKELQSGLKRKTNYLRMIVGLPDSIQVEFLKLDYSTVAALTPDQTASDGNTQLNLINQAQSVNELSQKQVQSEYLPTLDLKFNLLWSAQSENLNLFSDEAYGNNISTLGLKLDIPIYHGAEKKKKLQELEISRDMLDIQKLKLKEGYALQYANSVEDFELKKAKYIQLQEIAKLKKRYLEKANKQFAEEILPIKDVLEAQSALMDIQMKSSELLLELKLAELNYYKWSNQIVARME